MNKIKKLIKDNPITFIIVILALKTMDWDLLLIFSCFFMFSGNISRITFISNFLINMLSKSVLVTGLISCQFISNVPTAVLLANYMLMFTVINLAFLIVLLSYTLLMS